MLNTGVRVVADVEVFAFAVAVLDVADVVAGVDVGVQGVADV